MAKYDLCPCGLNKVCDCDYKKIRPINEALSMTNADIINYASLGAMKPTEPFVVTTDGKRVDEIDYKYAEGQIIADFKAYIDKTYSQHYKTDEQSIECFDAWIAMGDSTPTFRNTAMKYLWRYGKKHGNNKDDLMKALHYVLMCMYVDHYKDKK